MGAAMAAAAMKATTREMIFILSKKDNGFVQKSGERLKPLCRWRKSDMR
jgi:hypothetical protein